MKNHQYKTKVLWTGNTGESTKNYRSYQRNYTISVDGKVEILGSSDPAFLGDPKLHNPEDYFWLLYRPVICCGIFIFVRSTKSLFWNMKILQKER
ncbi:OsmC family protein [Epilithonimonas sp. UC225_85]|uniref:OsmC family protein n=1 Tax=Epilithonimonas sp. UC225_85 TaxID=3350167 RepID=UPI0036D35CC7